MSSEIITVVVAALGGGAAFWGAVKGGLINIRIGTNGTNGDKKENRIDELEKHAVVANHEMGEVKETLGEIKADIKETHTYLREHADKDNEIQTKILLAINDLKK